MNKLLKSARHKRSFLPANLNISSWTDIEPFADQLLKFPVISVDDLKKWLRQRSEFDAVLEEEKAWLFINQSCHTGNKEYAESFNHFVTDIDQKYSIISNELDKKLISFCENNTYPEDYEIFIRYIRLKLKIFSEANVRLLSEMEVEEQKYGAVTGSMMVNYNDEEITLQQAQNILKSTDRKERKEAFELIWNRRAQDFNILDELFNQLLSKRHTLAQNAGFDNYLVYRFVQLGRFDYSIADCEQFHKAVSDNIVPIIDHLHNSRKQKLELDVLHPYDLDVDPDLKPALKPFSTTAELVEKTIRCFSEIDPSFGKFISTMQENGYLDLESRKGKAPGGYNYPLYESNVPFIFMNATNNLRDLETMVHEGGHAIHAFLCKDLPLVYYKDTPAEIAEVASMAMELISMEHWGIFFKDKEELKRAQRSQLEGVLSVLPWVATIDKFQHWLYKHPGHTMIERIKAWQSIEKEFGSSVVDWEDYEDFHKYLWQKQIHLFQFPLYYIEYGIAQLAAIAIWKNYTEDPRDAITRYKDALSLGYSKTLPELYDRAGTQFRFTSDYIHSLSDFVLQKLDSIE